MTTRVLDELPSRNATGAFRAAERADPYWDGMFATGISDGWVSASQYRRATPEQKRWSGIPDSFVTDPGKALAQMRTNRHRPSILGALGAVASWRTVTREQLAAITGSAVMARTYPASLSAPFSAGLLSHGHVSAGMNRLAPARDRMSMWAAGDQVDAFARYRTSLTFAEHIAITGGQGWDAEHRFDRHNVLTTELALRVAEFCDVATVLGEKPMGLPSLLAAAGIEAAQSDLGRKPDAGIIRRDGLVIGIETTASVGTGFRAKIAKWAQVLQRYPSYELPLVILVVDASTPSQSTRTASKNTTATEIQAAIREAVRDYPGTALNRTADRIGMVAWPAWFPAAGRATSDFLDLTASFLDRSHGHGDGWRDVRLLDEDEMPYREGSPSAGEVIATNSRLLSGTPHWLRPGIVPRIDQYLLDELDTTGVETLADPAVPDRMTGPGFTQSVAGRKWRHLVSLDDASAARVPA